MARHHIAEEDGDDVDVDVKTAGEIKRGSESGIDQSQILIPVETDGTARESISTTTSTTSTATSTSTSTATATATSADVTSTHDVSGESKHTSDAIEQELALATQHAMDDVAREHGIQPSGIPYDVPTSATSTSTSTSHALDIPVASASITDTYTWDASHDTPVIASQLASNVAALDTRIAAVAQEEDAATTATATTTTTTASITTLHDASILLTAIEKYVRSDGVCELVVQLKVQKEVLPEPVWRTHASVDPRVGSIRVRY